MSETEEDFDEDVLLNGPLHEYLQACGDPTTPLNCATSFADPDSEVLKATWKIIPIKTNELFKSAKLEQECLSRVCDLVLTSNLIDSIDEHLIEEERVGIAGRDAKSSNSTAIWTCAGSAVLSVLGSRFATGRLFNCLTATAAVSAAASTVFVVSQWWQRLKLHNFKRRFSYYISEQLAMDANIGDAIRSIRQREVVLYGLLSTDATKKQSICSTQQCFLPLRLALIAALQSAVLYTRVETQQLAKRICSVDEVKNLTSSIESEFDSLLADSSPPVDLATIKALWHWYYLLRSEYLRCLVWGMFRQEIASTEHSLCSMKSAHDITTREQLECMKRMTAAGRALEVDVGEAKTRRRVVNEQSSRGTALQALRLRLSIAQERTDQLIETEEKNGNELRSELSLVGRALDEARDCLEELLAANASPPPAVPPAANVVALVDRESCPVAPRVIPVDYEPTISDQVFEAVVRISDEITSPPSESDQRTFANDDAVSKKTARSVLNELKTALVGRSEQMREREQKALAEFRCIPLEQLIAEEMDEKSHSDNESTYSGDAEESLSLSTDDFAERTALRSELAAQILGRFAQSGGACGSAECFEGTGDVIMETSSSSSDAES